ncbi:MAG: hypothetical protein J5441_01870 [Clostridia bacterium]|nr:hypothetical protein [Clostridia bacterium]
MKKKYIGVFSRICGAFSVLLFVFLSIFIYMLASGSIPRWMLGNTVIYASAAAAVFSITGIVLSLVERRTNTNVKLFWYVNLFECCLTFMTYALWWLYTMLVAGGSYYEGTRGTVRLIMFIIALAFPVILGAVVYLAAKWLSAKPKPAEKEPE